MKFLKLVALGAAALLACAPAAAQNIATLPNAATLTGVEKMPAAQGTGCATKVQPCVSVAISPAAIATYLAPTFQPKDAGLDAIAALATQPFGRSLLTQADAASVRSYLGVAASGANTDITSITGSAARLTTARTVAISGAVTGTATAFNGTAAITIPVTALDVGAATAGTLPLIRGGTGRTTASPVLSAARQSASSFQTITNAFTTIQVNTAAIDTAACFSTTTSICTLAEAGIYVLSAKLRVADGAGSGVSYGIGIGTSNADSASFFWSVTAGSRLGIANSVIWNGAVGDQIRLFAYADQSLPVTGAELNIYRIR